MINFYYIYRINSVKNLYTNYSKLVTSFENISLLNDSMIASFDKEKGQWVYKTNEDMRLRAPFKKDGSLKQPYKDMPRFQVIIDYENRFVKDYNKELAQSVKEMSGILNSFGR